MGGWTYKLPRTQLILLTRSLSLQRRARLGWRDTISKPASGQCFSQVAGAGLTDDFAAFPVLGSLDYPSAVPAAYIEYSLERTLWFVPGLGK